MYSKWYEITLQQFLSDRCTEVISCQIERFFSLKIVGQDELLEK